MGEAEWTAALEATESELAAKRISRASGPWPTRADWDALLHEMWMLNGHPCAGLTIVPGLDVDVGPSPHRFPVAIP